MKLKKPYQTVRIKWQLTLTSIEKFDPSITREKKSPYTYKTGAIYDGEWRGGFRDG